MNESNTNPGNAPTREEILIGRVTDGEASPNDWAEIESIAGADPTVWHRLAASQRAHARVESAVEDAIAVAELIDAPDMRRVRRPVIARVREYSGWALAAGLALALIVTLMNPGAIVGVDDEPERVADRGTGQGAGGASIPYGDSLPPGGASAGGLLTAESPADASPRALYDRYLHEGYEEGFVVRELTPALHEVRALPGGGYELIIARGHVERRNVTDLKTYRVQEDEWGREHLVPERGGASSIPVKQVY